MKAAVESKRSPILKLVEPHAALDHPRGRNVCVGVGVCVCVQTMRHEGGDRVHGLHGNHRKGGGSRCLHPCKQSIFETCFCFIFIRYQISGIRYQVKTANIPCEIGSHPSEYLTLQVTTRSQVPSQPPHQALLTG